MFIIYPQTWNTKNVYNIPSNLEYNNTHYNLKPGIQNNHNIPSCQI